MRKRIMTLLIAAAAAIGPAGAGAKVKVVASTTDLAAIAKAIGGDHVDVQSIVRGAADPHFVEVLPSYLLKISRADVYLKVGMDLDYWAQSLVDGSRNARLIIVDCSRDIEPLERPTTKVDPSMGDIHVQGNPHYWLDPQNGWVVAGTIAQAITQADPSKSDAFDAGLRAFRRALEERIRSWQELAAPLDGTEIVTYHNSWPYFCRAFGVRVVGFVEPKPGIEPTPSHTANLIRLVKERGIRVIGKEPYFSDRAPKAIARETGARVIDLPTSVGGAKAAGDYFALFDVLIDRLLAGLEE